MATFRSKFTELQNSELIQSNEMPQSDQSPDLPTPQDDLSEELQKVEQYNEMVKRARHMVHLFSRIIMFSALFFFIFITFTTIYDAFKKTKQQEQALIRLQNDMGEIMTRINSVINNTQHTQI